jgi:uncharacterized membrane protein
MTADQASKTTFDLEQGVETDNRVQELGQLLLDGGLTSLSKRERRVIATIAQHRHVTLSINRTVEELETPGERLADRVAQFGGSWTFILVFIAFLAGWIVLNTMLLSRARFDSYPFIFLNLMLSMVAALQAPIILMSQNRQAARDRIAAALDYEVNLKAELEIMALHEKLDALRIARLEEMLEEQKGQLRRLLHASGIGADGRVD